MSTHLTKPNTKPLSGETLFVGAMMNVLQGRIVRKGTPRVSNRQAVPARLSVCLVKEQAGRSTTARSSFFRYVHE